MKPPLKKHQRTPNFRLATIDGEIIELLSYRQRQNLVLLFARNESEEMVCSFISPFTKNYLDYRFENTEILFILFSGSREGIKQEVLSEMKFPVLLDLKSHVASVYLNLNSETARDSGVFILDQFGELIEQWQAEDYKKLPPQKEILDSLKWIELQCPE